MDARMPWTRPIRAMLFVPGNRPNWIEKARGSGADALVLDLEDSVVLAAKAEARRISAQAIEGGAGGGPPLYVRTNKSVHIYDFDDIQAVVRPGLSGVFVTKADGPEDIALISRMIAEVEHRQSMKIGAVGLVVAIETARAAQFAFEIASHPRVDALVACAARNADVARALGFSWTPEGLETLYHRSRAIMACGKTCMIWRGSAPPPRSTGGSAFAARSCCTRRTFRWSTKSIRSATTSARGIAR
jgi:citrate lyase subunit beta/citryl-CoA lyase